MSPYQLWRKSHIAYFQKMGIRLEVKSLRARWLEMTPSAHKYWQRKAGIIAKPRVHHTARNIDIHTRHMHGEKLCVLAKQYHISAARAAQIYHREERRFSHQHPGTIVYARVTR